MLGVQQQTSLEIVDVEQRPKARDEAAQGFGHSAMGVSASSSFQLLPRFHWLESLQETFRVEQQTFLGVDAKQRLKETSRRPPKGTLECQTI
jgi:hypothetical protein